LLLFLLLRESICITLLYFFFSSRRRHTISKRDWSSDVCSSDLIKKRGRPIELYRLESLYRRIPPHHAMKEKVFSDFKKARTGIRDRKSRRVGKEGRARWEA